VGKKKASKLGASFKKAQNGAGVPGGRDSRRRRVKDPDTTTGSRQYPMFQIIKLDLCP